MKEGKGIQVCVTLLYLGPCVSTDKLNKTHLSVQ